MIEKLSNLYILLYPEKSVLKVGKANNIINRSKSLKWIGAPDYQASYWLSTDESSIYRIETGFKKFLHKFRVFIGEGDGKSEIYDIACLEKILSHLAIDFGREAVKKGIRRSNLKLSETVLSNKSQLNIELAKIQSFKFYFERANKQITQVNELVKYLKDNYQDIPYQIIDSGGDTKFIRFKAQSWPRIERRIKLIMSPLYPELTTTILQTMMFRKNSVMFISELQSDAEVVQLRIFIPERSMRNNYCRGSECFIDALEECWKTCQKLPPISPCLTTYLNEPRAMWSPRSVSAM